MVRSRSTASTPSTASRAGIRSSRDGAGERAEGRLLARDRQPGPRRASTTSANRSGSTARMIPTGADWAGSLTAPGADPSRRPWRGCVSGNAPDSQTGFEIGRRSVGVCLGEQGEDARDVRRGHAGAAQALVPAARGGRAHVPAGRGDVDLAALAVDAAVGEERRRECLVERAHRQDGGAVGGPADGLRYPGADGCRCPRRRRSPSRARARAGPASRMSAGRARPVGPGHRATWRSPARRGRRPRPCPPGSGRRCRCPRC